MEERDAALRNETDLSLICCLSILLAASEDFSKPKLASNADVTSYSSREAQVSAREETKPQCSKEEKKMKFDQV